MVATPPAGGGGADAPRVAITVGSAPGSGGNVDLLGEHRLEEGLLDEDPRSYKDIDQVMADQADLVRPLHTLSQILNYKGL